jgi:CRISPR-associated exonuclease Cas4
MGDAMTTHADERDDTEPALEPVMISTLEHYSYCPRQCALIHLEQTFTENAFTIRGRHAHERVDDPDAEQRPGIHREYALPLWSERLGLTGRADLVEFSPDGPYPVEYKSGKKRAWGHEALQLCAQAMCLEEMLGTRIERGAIWYHGSRRRREVVFDDTLRRLVEETTAAVRAMLAGGTMPPAINDARCTHCSLIDACLPAVERAAHAPRWLRDLYDTNDEDD